MFSFPSKQLVFLLFIGLIALRVLYYWGSDGFSIQRIDNTFPNSHTLSPPSEAKLEELKKICSTPFTYLGKGSQAYAFQSEDGKHVLKLFKCYHLKPIPWLEKLELPNFLNRYVQTHLKRRYHKTKLSLESYKIAHDTLSEECGLIFLQMVPSQDYEQEVTFTDKIGRTFTVNIANYGFMIQKKVDLIMPTLDSYIKNNETDKAKELLTSIVDLLIARSKKGVADQDPDLHKNCGCIGTHAQFIDVGSFHLRQEVKSPTVYLQDARKITRKLKNYLEPRSPELAVALEENLRLHESQKNIAQR
jgi:hypothetical protein